MSLVQDIGKAKLKSGTPIYRPEREKEIIDRLVELNTGLLTSPAISAIFHEIFAISRNSELPERVAFLGPEGSFTHQAAEMRFGPTSEYLELASIRAVFKSVQTRRSRFGIVPMENNQQGSVHETIALLANSEVKIVAEVSMPIHFCFASKEHRIDKISKIYSKDIAFRQCEKFLNDTFSDQTIELVPVDSTSRAARMARNEKNAAAICSHIAARLAEFPILFENIEDSKDNTTRFLILSDHFENNISGNDKTSILAKLGDHPGALADFLMDFHTSNINLTKIESMPAKKGHSFSYWFFIDFEGHHSEPTIAEVLQKHEKEITVLGSYVNTVA
jgi:chorismate mutase/prephenate dehydratase